MIVIVREENSGICISSTRKVRKTANITVTNKIVKVMESLNRTSLATNFSSTKPRIVIYNITLSTLFRYKYQDLTQQETYGIFVGGVNSGCSP